MITGCSIIEQPNHGEESATAPPGAFGNARPGPLSSSRPGPLSTAPRGELLVEDLVSQAGRLGNHDIAGIGSILRSPEEAGREADLEPITPTIPMTANHVVERTINDYLQNRRRVLSLWLERSATYFPMIERIFAEEGVPDELKYIALNESGLRPTARSGVGAAGMWQFMPATGRGAGLEINNWVDERLDPEKSTRAAARHFKELLQMYSGNWHLALAGYNCSYRCISRAVRRAGGSIENPPSFWEIYPYLPQETREFVPKFIAAALLVSNPEMFGIPVEQYGPELTYDVVLVQGMLTLEDAARLAGTTVEVLRGLNPSLRRNTLPQSDQPFALKIPPGSHDLFVTAFRSLPEKAKVGSAEYIVKRGDTLGKIARQHQTSVEKLQAANGIKGDMIWPQQKLLIPGSGISTTLALADAEPVHISYGRSRNRPILLHDQFQLVEQTGSRPEEVLMAVSLTLDEADSTLVPTVYKVRGGDTLGAISERFRVSINDIRRWNGINGSLIRVGQELTLHTQESAPAPSTYQVRRGDNLGAIARRFGVSVDKLKSWNGLNSDTIFPGQQLSLN